MSDYPYADRFAIHRSLPEQGMSRQDVLAQLHTMATEEDAFWETGKCSGTMYCGDHDHYTFMNEAFGLFAHVNVLQRDMCPSATKFEAEIIAMTLGLFSGDGGRRDRRRPLRPRHHRRDRQHPACDPRLPRARGPDDEASPDPTSSSPRRRTPPSTRPATSSASSCGAPRSTRSRRRSTSTGCATTSTTGRSP